MILKKFYNNIIKKYKDLTDEDGFCPGKNVLLEIENINEYNQKNKKIFNKFTSIIISFIADMSVIIMDIYTINRILNKNYVKNAVVYAGNKHIQNFLNILKELPKNFDDIKVDVNIIKNHNNIYNLKKLNQDDYRCIKLDKNKKNPFDISFLVPKDNKKNNKSKSRKSRKSNINQKAGGNYYENTRYQQPAYPEIDDPNVKTTYNIDKAYDNLIHGKEIDNSNYLNIDNTRSSNFENGNITDQVDYTYALSEQSFS